MGVSNSLFFLFVPEILDADAGDDPDLTQIGSIWGVPESVMNTT